MLKHLWQGLLGGGFIILLVGCSPAGGGSADNPGTMTSGPVSIATDHTTYAPTEGMQVTIKNQLSMDIYAFDTRASCTILGLEQQNGGAWQGSQASRCPLGRRALPVKIGSGQVYTATIRPGSGLGAANAAFPDGTYRLVLTYASSPAELIHTSGSTTIYSATLTVAGQASGGTPPTPGGAPSASTPVALPTVTPRPGS